ncbi:MAG TPA: RidA family protein [Nitrospiria bacterium]|nr:RidA family protein [Nitrospiria bacterium]
MDIEAKLKSVGLALPEAPKPVASYIPAVRAGNLLFLSGMLPFVNGKLGKTGKVGRELSVAEGQESAKIALLNALAVVKAELGSLNKVGRIIRMGVHVASAEGFTQQPAVGNGASDLLVQLFGDAGRHARLALGAAELPLGAPVELELIVQAQE